MSATPSRGSDVYPKRQHRRSTADDSYVDSGIPTRLLSLFQKGA